MFFGQPGRDCLKPNTGALYFFENIHFCELLARFLEFRPESQVTISCSVANKSLLPPAQAGNGRLETAGSAIDY